MNQYFASVKNQARLGFKNFVLYAVFVLGFYLFGFAGSIVLSLDSGSTGSLGSVMAAMMTFFVVFITAITNFCTGFEYAVKMGVTRKAYITGSLIVTYLQAVLIMLFLWGLSILESLLLHLFFPDALQELSLAAFLSLPLCLILPLIVVPIAALMGALVEKWGKKAFWIIYILIFVPIIFSSQIGDIIATRDTASPLSRLVLAIYDAIIALPPAGFKALAAAAPLLCLVVAVLMLRKQSVRN